MTRTALHIARSLATLAGVALAYGQFEYATRLFRATDALVDNLGTLLERADSVQGINCIDGSDGTGGIGSVVHLERIASIEATYTNNNHSCDGSRLVTLRNMLEDALFAARRAGEQTIPLDDAVNLVLQLSSVIELAGKVPSGVLTSIGKPSGGGNGSANSNGKCATTSQSCMLTAREIEVLRLIAVGQNNAQIAKRLCISPHTVQAHVRSMYAKTNVSSRNAVAHYAVAHKLL
jgi:DNA-binding CsgD family transcriptional regulator